MSASLSEQPSASTGGVWVSLNRFLLTLIVLTFFLAIGFRFLPESSHRREQQARVDELKTQIEKEEQLLARANREAELLARDPEYVSLLARDRLDLVKDGEKVYRLDQPKPEPAKPRAGR